MHTTESLTAAQTIRPQLQTMTSVKLTDCTLRPFQAPDTPGSDTPYKFRNFLVLELVPSAEPVPAWCPDILGHERGSLKGSWVSPPRLPWAFLWWFLSLLLGAFGLLVLESQELVQLSRTSLLLLRGWILVLRSVSPAPAAVLCGAPYVPGATSSGAWGWCRAHEILRFLHPSFVCSHLLSLVHL